MMKIIIVKGKENTGKTTLVKYVYDVLIKKGAESIFFKLEGAHFEDFVAVVMLEGKIIAFCSLGDACFEDNLEKEKYINACMKDLFFLEMECDVFIGVKNDDLPDDKYEDILKQYCASSNFDPIFVFENKNGKGYPSMKQKQEKAKEIIEKIGF